MEMFSFDGETGRHIQKLYFLLNLYDFGSSHPECDVARLEDHVRIYPDGDGLYHSYVFHNDDHDDPMGRWDLVKKDITKMDPT